MLDTHFLLDRAVSVNSELRQTSQPHLCHLAPAALVAAGRAGRLR
jgi:hypothetical protein